MSGQIFLTRGSGRVIRCPLGSGRVGSAHLLNDFGSGRAGSALKNSGNFRSKSAVFFKIFQKLWVKLLKVTFLNQNSIVLMLKNDLISKYLVIFRELSGKL